MCEFFIDKWFLIQLWLFSNAKKKTIVDYMTVIFIVLQTARQYRNMKTILRFIIKIELNID